jgi:hypothetical protein
MWSAGAVGVFTFPAALPLCHTAIAVTGYGSGYGYGYGFTGYGVTLRSASL